MPDPWVNLAALYQRHGFALPARRIYSDLLASACVSACVVKGVGSDVMDEDPWALEPIHRTQLSLQRMLGSRSSALVSWEDYGRQVEVSILTDLLGSENAQQLLSIPFRLLSTYLGAGRRRDPPTCSSGEQMAAAPDAPGSCFTLSPVRSADILFNMAALAELGSDRKTNASVWAAAAAAIEARISGHSSATRGTSTVG